MQNHNGADDLVSRSSLTAHVRLEEERGDLGRKWNGRNGASGRQVEVLLQKAAGGALALLLLAGAAHLLVTRTLT